MEWWRSAAIYRAGRPGLSSAPGKALPPDTAVWLLDSEA